VRRLVKQLRHGQITIPKEFRDALGLQDDGILAISLVEGKLEVEAVTVEPKPMGSPWARELYELFAPVRKAAKSHSEPEINDAIDDAVREVRRRKA
jgi:AbrB family looped-hinge helix DNA binding protein